MKNAYVIKVVSDFANMVERNLGGNRAGVCTVTVSELELKALRELIAVGQAVEDFREQIYIIGQRDRD
jgi:hypothetical protein